MGYVFVFVLGVVVGVKFRDQIVEKLAVVKAKISSKGE